MIYSGSTVDPYNSYCSLTSFTEDFMIIPISGGWKYIPRTKSKDDNRTED